MSAAAKDDLKSAKESFIVASLFDDRRVARDGFFVYRRPLRGSR